MRDFIDKEKRSTIMETSKIERLRDMKKNEESSDFYARRFDPVAGFDQLRK